MEVNVSKRVIEVVDYDPSWTNFCEIERVLLRKAILVEHIGSTAVANLTEKPVIDILIEITSLTVLGAVK